MECSNPTVMRLRLPLWSLPQSQIFNSVKWFGDWKNKVFGSLPKYPSGQHRPVTLLPAITIPTVGQFRGRTVLVRIPNLKRPQLHLSERLTTIVMSLPFIAGFIMAVVLNSHAYLRLGKKGCYGSYVSGRFGDLDFTICQFSCKVVDLASAEHFRGFSADGMPINRFV